MNPGVRRMSISELGRLTPAASEPKMLTANPGWFYVKNISNNW